MVSGPTSEAVGRLKKKKKKTTPIVVVWFLVHRLHWILMLAIVRSVYVQKSKLTMCNGLCKEQSLFVFETACIIYCMCCINQDGRLYCSNVT